MAAKGLQVRIDADAKPFARGLKNAESDMDRFKRSAKRTGVAVGSAFKAGAAVATAAIAAVGAVVVKSVGDFSEFETSVREVGTLLGDVNDADLSKIRGEIEELSKTFGRDVGVLSTAYYDALSAGVPLDDAFGFLEKATKFAVAGVTEVTDAVGLMTSAMNAFAIPASEADRITDAFFSTVRFGKTTVEEIAAAFSNVGPVAALAGASIEEVGAWIANLTLSGTPTAQATTQIRSAITELINPTMKGAKAFEALTGEAFAATVASEGFAGALEAFSDRIIATDANVIELFGSIEAATGIVGIAGSKWEGFASILGQIEAGAGATDQAFSVMSESFGFSIDVLGQNVKGMMRDVGEALIPTLEAMQPLILMTVEKFGELATEVIEALMPAFEELAPLFSELVLRSMPALVSFIELLIPLIPLLEAGVVALAITFEGLNAVFELLLPSFKEAGEALDWFVGHFRAFDDVGINAMEGWVIIARTLAVEIVPLLRRGGELFRWGGRSLDSMVRKVEILSAMFDALGDVIEWIVGLFQSLVNLDWGSGLRWVGDLFEGAFSWDGNQLNVGKSGLGGFLTGLVPGLASGGIVTRPTLAMIGESGPEAVIPLRRGGMGGGITINFNGPVYGDRRQLGDVVVRSLEDYVRRNGPLSRGLVT